MRMSMENLKGRKVPRGGLKDQRAGTVGRRDIRQGTASPIDFTPKGVRPSVVRNNLPRR